MAVAYVASAGYTDAVDPSVTLSSGTSTIYALLFARRADPSTITSVTLGGNAMTKVGSDLSADGGANAISGSVWRLASASNPGAGARTLDTTWSVGTEISFAYAIVELSGVNQSTLNGTMATATTTALATGGTISNTLNSEAGQFGLSFCAYADDNSGTANFGPPSDGTEVIDTGTTRTGIAVAYDESIASAAQAYNWTVSNGSATTQSVLTGAFAVYAEATGISIPVIIAHLKQQGIT